MLGQQAPQSLALGQLGSYFIQDTTLYAGLSIGRIQCISACTFTALVSSTLSAKTGTLADLTLAAGMEIQGIFTAIRLASGSVIAYNA